MAKGWKCFLTDSTDMTILGPMRNAHDRTISVDLNKSGSAECWIPSSEDVAQLVAPWKTALVFQCDDVWRWSGPVSSRHFDMAAGKLTVSALGWFERLMHLDLQDQTTTYTNMDAGAIIHDLLTKAQQQDHRLPVTIGTIEQSQSRTITYSLDQNIGQAILDLCNIESGTDFSIDPVTRHLSVHARLGVDRPNCKWTFINDPAGLTQHTNLANCEQTVDGSTVVNQIRPRGRYGSGFAEDPVSQADNGVFQEAPSLSDVVDPTILAAYAAGEVIYRANPRVTYTLTPKPNTKASVPRLFRDFDVGDTGRLTARRDFLDVSNQPVRMFGATLSIADNGTETITNLQTTAS